MRPKRASIFLPKGDDQASGFLVGGLYLAKGEQADVTVRFQVLGNGFARNPDAGLPDLGESESTQPPGLPHPPVVSIGDVVAVDSSVPDAAPAAALFSVDTFRGARFRNGGPVVEVRGLLLPAAVSEATDPSGGGFGGEDAIEDAIDDSMVVSGRSGTTCGGV